MTGVCLYLLLEHQSFQLRKGTGKVGKESAAAKYAAATPPSDFSIQAEKPYAEVCYCYNCSQMIWLLRLPAMDGHASFPAI